MTDVDYYLLLLLLLWFSVRYLALSIQVVYKKFQIKNQTQFSIWNFQLITNNRKIIINDFNSKMISSI